MQMIVMDKVALNFEETQVLCSMKKEIGSRSY